MAAAAQLRQSTLARQPQPTLHAADAARCGETTACMRMAGAGACGWRVQVYADGASKCDASHGMGRRTCICPGYFARHHLQIIGNKANYAGLQRDTGTELSVLLVP